MNLNQTSKSYLKIILLNAIVLVILRLLETALITLNYGASKLLFQSEVIGLFCDLIITTAILVVLSPVFYQVFKFSGKTANYLFVSFIAVMAVLHFFILKYFLYQLIPLDTSLYKYSIKEIVFTINTSGIDYAKTLLLLIAVISTIVLSSIFLDKIDYPKIKSKVIYLLLVVLVVTMGFLYFSDIQQNIYAKNKSLFFYSRSLSYFFQKDTHTTDLSKQDALEFQQLYPGKLFSDNDYPLLHEFKKLNVLKPYFNQFGAAPNIVFLIVEGLSDDFLYDFNGGDLRPFTRS